MLISFSADYPTSVARFLHHGRTSHHPMARQRTALDGNLTFTLLVHDLAQDPWITCSVFGALCARMLAGADVCDYSAPLPTLVRPPTLPSITPTFPLPFLLSLRVRLGNVLLLANVFPALRCCKRRN
jgi:hypothetical protein